MDDCVKQQRVGNLPVKPLRLVQWQYLDLRSYPPEDVLAHGKKDDGSIDGQYQSRAS